MTTQDEYKRVRATLDSQPELRKTIKVLSDTLSKVRFPSTEVLLQLSADYYAQRIPERSCPNPVVYQFADWLTKGMEVMLYVAIYRENE